MSGVNSKTWSWNIKKGRKPRKTLPQPAKKEVKAIVNRAIDRATEDKFITNGLTAGGLSSISSIYNELNICNPAQGDTSSTRTGRRIKIKSVELRGVIAQGSNDGTANDSYNVLRMVLGIYDGTSDTPLTGTSLNSPITKELNNHIRRILVDRYIPLNSVGKGTNGYIPTIKNVRIYKKLNTLIEYADDTTTYPNKRLILSFQSDSGVVVNPGFVCGYVTVRYEDA